VRCSIKRFSASEYKPLSCNPARLTLLISCIRDENKLQNENRLGENKSKTTKNHVIDTPQVIKGRRETTSTAQLSKLSMKCFRLHKRFKKKTYRCTRRKWLVNLYILLSMQQKTRIISGNQENQKRPSHVFTKIPIHFQWTLEDPNGLKEH